MGNMVSVLSSLIIWCSVAIVAFRVISNSGIGFKKNKFDEFVLDNKTLKSSFEVTRNDILKIFGLAMLFRFIVFLISISAIYILRDQEFSFSDLLNVYLQWDARHYRSIALGGYDYFVEDGKYLTLVFYPLYAWLTRLLMVLVRNEIASGILTSWLLYAGACCYIYKLMSLDYNKQTALRTIIYISVFPHALFFGVMMSESTLLFTAAATLYYIRKHQWLKVGIFGAFAALSRMAGLILAIPAAIEWLEHYRIFEKLKEKRFAEVWKLFYSKGLMIFIMLAGMGIYLLCNYKVTGDCFKFLEYQENHWHNTVEYFGNSIKLIFDYVVNEKTFTRFAIWIPEACSIIFVFTLLIYGLRKSRSMYSAFLIGYIIINTSMGWPLSVARYMTCAIPAFMALSDFSERHRWSEPIITSSMAVAMGVYFTAYFMSKQIL